MPQHSADVTYIVIHSTHYIKNGTCVLIIIFTSTANYRNIDTITVSKPLLVFFAFVLWVNLRTITNNSDVGI